jgi:murein endopeptidase
VTRTAVALVVAAVALIGVAVAVASGDPVSAVRGSDPAVGVPLLVPLSDLPAARTEQRVQWRRSEPLGQPYSGRLVRGVRLPPEGDVYFTWDPVQKTKPNRGWRRWGTDRLLRTTLRVARRYASEHPEAPRLTIGDLSRPHGGDFGPQYGSIGHASHQNGLDIDIYYPRRDERERPPTRPSQVDLELSQRLVDMFVAAGAEKVFVGPSLDLRGPPRVVTPLVHHDNHIHVRLPGWSRLR